MKIIYLLFITVFISSCATKFIIPSERVEVQYYFSKTRYINNDPYDTPMYTKIKETGKDYIRIHDIFDATNDKMVSKARSAWAIKIDSVNYFNMRYVKDYQNPELYTKFDIEGHICALFIDDDTSSKVKSGGSYYGGGLVGVLMKDANKWGNNWEKSDGKKSKIIVINAIKPKTDNPRDYNTSMGDILSKKNFNQLLDTNFSEAEIDNYTFDQVIEIIHAINAY